MKTLINLSFLGGYSGMNNYDYNFDYISDTYIQTEKSFGFNVGLIGNFKFLIFCIRFEPGLVMSNRNLVFNPAQFGEAEFNQIFTSEKLSQHISIFPYF